MKKCLVFPTLEKIISKPILKNTDSIFKKINIDNKFVYLYCLEGYIDKVSPCSFNTIMHSSAHFLNLPEIKIAEISENIE